jgi:hypothetical protein
MKGHKLRKEGGAVEWILPGPPKGTSPAVTMILPHENRFAL